MDCPKGKFECTPIRPFVAKRTLNARGGGGGGGGREANALKSGLCALARPGGSGSSHIQLGSFVDSHRVEEEELLNRTH